MVTKTGTKVRLAIAVAAVLATTVVCAPSAMAAVWTIRAGDRVSPLSHALTTKTIDLTAAGNEYVGCQVVVSGSRSVGNHVVSLAWSADTATEFQSYSSLFKVGYVHITKPSSNVGAPAGLYGDPLLPATFGQRFSVPYYPTAFYILFHVPLGLPAGIYTGTLDVTDGSSVTAVAVHLRVWGFGWSKTSLDSAYFVTMRPVLNSLHSKLYWSSDVQDRIMGAYYRTWAEHGLDPGFLLPQPQKVDLSTGHTDLSSYAAKMDPYLSTNGLDLPSLRVPWMDHIPWPATSFDRIHPQILNYLTDLFRFYKAQGWASKSYTYVDDEPITVAQAVHAQTTARLVHQASAAAGFHERFLLTDDPRPTAIDTHFSNKFLLDDVDIWCPRMYWFFGRVPALRSEQARGKKIWWYTYLNPYARRVPTFLIDKPLADQRVLGWMAYQWNVDGMLYWSANKWTDYATGTTYRDPYMNPLSFRDRHGFYGNGEASLVYPGYEPQLGLNDIYAGPVTSLRFESLRDGIEENQYLRIAAKVGLDGYARRVAAAVSDYAYGPYSGVYLNFPSYTYSAARFDYAKQHIGEAIERAQAGQSLLVARGTVLDVATRRPILGVTVSDGLLSTRTDAYGRYTLSGVLHSTSLTISHPLYAGARITYNEGDAARTLVLRRLPGARVLADFETKPLFTFPGSKCYVSGSYASSGKHSLRVNFFHGAYFATWNVTGAARNLGRFHTLELDVYNPNYADHSHPWFLRVSAIDRRGHTSSIQYLLKPYAWTHITVKLHVRGFDYRNVAKIQLRTYTLRSEPIYIDQIIAR